MRHHVIIFCKQQRKTLTFEYGTTSLATLLPYLNAQNMTSKGALKLRATVLFCEALGKNSHGSLQGGSR